MTKFEKTADYKRALKTFVRGAIKAKVFADETGAYTVYLSKAEENGVKTVTAAICESVVDSANRLDAKLICTATISGSTAKIISNFKPKAPILALCPDEAACRRLALNWGVYTRTIPMYGTTDEVLNASVEVAKEFTPLETGDIVVLTGGFPTIGRSKTTNLMKIEEIK